MEVKYATTEPTSAQLRLIAILSAQLKMGEPTVRTFGEAGRLIRGLYKEREYRKRKRNGSKERSRTCMR